jgi:hypothetical protein
MKEFFKQLLHFHVWGKWSRPVVTCNSGHKQQWRECVVCGKCQFHTFRWDKQTNVTSINKALDAAISN